MKYLIVDGKEDLGKILARDLMQLGYDARYFHRTEDFVSWNREQKPDVIQVHDLDARTVQWHLQLSRDNPDASFICFSGRPDDKQQAERLGMHYINSIMKGYDILLKYAKALLKPKV